MPLRHDEIPSIDDHGSTWVPSDVAAQLRSAAVSRRAVLRALAGTGMAVGLTMVEWLPPVRLSRASAGWNTRYATWTDCHGYFSDSSHICTPTSWFISSDNCNGVHFHRDDSASGTCYAYRYTVKLTSCGGRNAWRWGSTRCSDGHLIYDDCGGGHRNTDSICRASAI